MMKFKFNKKSSIALIVGLLVASGLFFTINSGALFGEGALLYKKFTPTKTTNQLTSTKLEVPTKLDSKIIEALKNPITVDGSITPRTPECDEDEILNEGTNTCESCELGYEPNVNHSFCQEICPAEDEEYNSSTGRCDIIPIECEAGFEPNNTNDSCQSICDLDEEYNSSTGTCELIPVECPAGQELIPGTSECQDIPVDCSVTPTAAECATEVVSVSVENIMEYSSLLSILGFQTEVDPGTNVLIGAYKITKTGGAENIAYLNLENLNVDINASSGLIEEVQIRSWQNRSNQVEVPYSAHLTNLNLNSFPLNDANFDLILVYADLSNNTSGGNIDMSLDISELVGSAIAYGATDPYPLSFTTEDTGDTISFASVNVSATSEFMNIIPSPLVGVDVPIVNKLRQENPAMKFNVTNNGTESNTLRNINLQFVGNHDHIERITIFNTATGFSVGAINASAINDEGRLSVPVTINLNPAQSQDYIIRYAMNYDTIEAQGACNSSPFTVAIIGVEASSESVYTEVNPLPMVSDEIYNCPLGSDPF